MKGFIWKFFFFQRCPLEQIVLKVKLFDIGPPKAVLRLALQPPDPDDIERTVLLLKQVKRKKNLKCCHVTDLGAEPLFVFLWVIRRGKVDCLSLINHFVVTKAWTFWTSESCSLYQTGFLRAGCKENHFYSLPLDKLKLAFTSPDVISTSPKSFLTSRIDFTVLLLFKCLKKHHSPVGQVKNRIHQPDSKIR